MNWINEKDELERLINVEHVSYEDIGRRYNVTGGAIKKVAKKLGIDLPKRRAINPKETFNKGTGQNATCINCGEEKLEYRQKFCSHKCQHEYYYKKYIDSWKNGKENGIKGQYGLSNYIRKYLLEKNNYKCEVCGWGEKNQYTDSIPLEIHHKDGDYTNNKEENLQVLCPNCHSLTETHKSHNKKGRQGREKYYKN